jgi:hypothetical protein
MSVTHAINHENNLLMANSFLANSLISLARPGRANFLGAITSLRQCVASLWDTTNNENFPTFQLSNFLTYLRRSRHEPAAHHQS